MKLLFLFLGKTKESYLSTGIDKYTKRLSRYVQLEIKYLKDKKSRKNSSDEVVKENEAGILISESESSFRVVLDPQGQQITSENLSSLLSKWEGQGRKKISFLIGGPLGLSQTVINKADSVISLSKMTFTHDMTRLILIEQIYRAYTIKCGEKYHK